MRNAGALLFAVALAACGGNAATTAPRTFDLGTAAPSAKLPALRAVTVRAVAPFDGVEMQYRLAWRNAAELADYSNSRWAAAPAELLRKQLLRAVGEGVGKCALEVELHEFTQVFSAKEASEARIEMRAALTDGAVRVAARGIQVTEQGAGADAASGAAAMARAAERALGEMAGWLQAQPACR
jgi:cholesterol transport system auxiliary component